MTFDELNALSNEQAQFELSRCCGSARWARFMTAKRPYHSTEELLDVAARAFRELRDEDWLEAFSHHPKIGNIDDVKSRFASTLSWASGEQSGVRTSSEETLRGLADGNARYFQKFGYIFIVYASGKSAQEMLDILRERLSNSAPTEINIAATEQMKITRNRLMKLMN